MEFLNPIEVLKNLELKKDMTAADFGSGSGGWALPLAKILENGRVYAIDILEEPLSSLRSRAKLARIANIDAIKSDVEKGVSLLSESCDLVIMTNLLFQSENKSGVLTEGRRVLKQGGEILVVDWKKDAAFGPGVWALPEEVKNLAKDANLKLEKEFNAGNYHYGLVFKK